MSRFDFSWECKFQERITSWTVGEKKLLICRGKQTEKVRVLPRIVFPEVQEEGEESYPSEFREENAKDNQGKKDLKYSLHILDQVSSDHNQISFLVTSYKPGKFKTSFFIQNEGQRILVEPPLEWEVQSIIKTSMGLRPYGPRGPFLFPWPLEYKIVGGFLFTLFFLFCFFKLYKFLLRRWWRKKLIKSGESFSPYHKFNKEIRRMNRKIFQKSSLSSFSKDSSKDSSRDFSMDSSSENFSKNSLRDSSLEEIEETEEEEKCRSYIFELEVIFRAYLTQKFLIPVHLWKIKTLAKDIKFKGKKEKSELKKVFLNLAQEILFIFREFKKAKEDSSLKLSSLDCEQFTKWVHQWSEKLESLEKSQKKGSFKRSQL